ncbi:MAG: Bax inhibitor-1/YccA family protein [Fibrobacteria bacterium]|nr:Bax inhibitor-1/YccA family protein [Fibrobacteria bacterium]
MELRRSSMTFSDKMSRNVSISADKAQILRKTYLLLSLAVLGMMVGGKIGVSTPAILNLFFGFFGWILAMVALNAVPMIAMKFRHDPIMGTIAVFLDGFVSGIVLAPMLYVGQMISGQQIVTTAAWITLAIFASVTGYVYFTGLKWAPSRATFIGIFFAIIGAIVLNFFMNLTILEIAIAAGIGAFGVIVLVSATSELLHSNELDSPVPGALMLFSGVFMVFQAVFHLLMIFAGGDRD